MGFWSKERGRYETDRFSGVGGQSVRVISRTLALALMELGYQVALLYDYDSSIRNQRITAYLTYDQHPLRIR